MSLSYYQISNARRSVCTIVQWSGQFNNTRLVSMTGRLRPTVVTFKPDIDMYPCVRNFFCVYKCFNCIFYLPNVQFWPPENSLTSGVDTRHSADLVSVYFTEITVSQEKRSFPFHLFFRVVKLFLLAFRWLSAGSFCGVAYLTALPARYQVCSSGFCTCRNE